MTHANETTPAAVKLDAEGNCITICREGQTEFIHGLVAEGLSERKAVKKFIEAALSSLPEDDPYREKVTEGAVHAQYRRDTGKKSDKSKEVWRTAMPEEVPQPDKHHETVKADAAKLQTREGKIIERLEAENEELRVSLEEAKREIARRTVAEYDTGDRLSRTMYNVQLWIRKTNSVVAATPKADLTLVAKIAAYVYLTFAGTGNVSPADHLAILKMVETEVLKPLQNLAYDKDDA